MDQEDFKERIAIGESRNQEFKRTMNWADNNTKFKLTKSILSMCNVRNGGTIILGIEETSNKTHVDAGMPDADYASFKIDEMKDHVGIYADPFVEFQLQTKEFGVKKFVVITVDEFERDPVICKRAYNLNGKRELEDGDICTRTRGNKSQSSKVISHIDLRDIIDLSVEKRAKEFHKLLNIIGLAIHSENSDEHKFIEQIGDF